MAMIHLPGIWNIIKCNMPQGQWIHLDEIYNIVEKHGKLDAEDYEPQSPVSDLPRWKRNVRNVMQYRKEKGEIEWDGQANYRLP